MMAPLWGVLGLLMTPACSSSSEEQILSWEGAGKDPHPCLYLTPKQVSDLRQTRPDLAAMEPPRGGWHLHRDGMDELIASALVAGNAEAEATIITQSIAALDALIEQLPRTIEENVGPHAYAKQAGQAAGLADAALAAKQLTEAQRAEIVGRIARICYQLNRPDYWDVKSGKCTLNPNMTTSARGYRLAFAALIPSHPKASAWFETALKHLKRELDDWTDSGGGMLECPHYSMVIFDQWIGSFLIARNAGAPEDGHLFDPQLRQAMEWFGNISTPPDSRGEGFRRWQSLGHTYPNERCGMFGTMASIYREKDPEFAGNMAWMHREQGSFEEPGILSYYPALMGYRIFYQDRGIAPVVPDWGSSVYPETGVLLRNVIDSDRETMLHLIAGRQHSHYYNDSGSLTLWGLGRELADEDGYGKERVMEGRPDKNIDANAVHSMIDGPATANPEEVMAIREFSASASFDYFRGTRRGWQRQIGFVKGTDPLGPNYFLLADTLDAKSVPATWRLYLAAEDIRVDGSRVTVTGLDDVDLDLVFLRPNGIEIQAHGDHISVTLQKSGTLAVVLYPRLKSVDPATITPLEDGRAVRVETPAGTDYGFLDPEPVEFQEGKLAFKGRAGVIRVRGDEISKLAVGPCDIPPDWEEGDPELRMIRWEGPQYPRFPYP